MLALPSSPSSPIFNAGRSAIILTDIQAQQTSGLACLSSERSCQFTSAFQSAAVRSAVPGSGKLCARPASSLSPPSTLAGVIPRSCGTASRDRPSPGAKPQTLDAVSAEQMSSEVFGQHRRDFSGQTLGPSCTCNTRTAGRVPPEMCLSPKARP